MSAPAASGQVTSQAAAADLYRQIRGNSRDICTPLETEDYVIQTMNDVSPPKWHLAHTSWFFETFLLRAFLPAYRGFHARFPYLFNSYYIAAGERHPRPERGLQSRPTVEEVYAYRTHVDRFMEELLLGASDASWGEMEPLFLLGLAHEEQHQELLLTDIKHIFATSVLRPAYQPNAADQPAPDGSTPAAGSEWIAFPGGVEETGFTGAGFSYDNERPRHRVYLEPFQLASRLVTNRDYLAFIGDGGYERADLWLSEGWAAVEEQTWRAPLYWEGSGEDWSLMTLSGMREVGEDEPVCHVSYFEADAFARWSERRLPREAEWECAAASHEVAGHFYESARYHPAPAAAAGAGRLQQLFGDAWEWTSSPYIGYPGYESAPGAVGEYNGKFMCNQYVLRGGSCATSRRHIRPTYRNFFPASARWQFSGIRLASD